MSELDKESDFVITNSTLNNLANILNDSLFNRNKNDSIKKLLRLLDIIHSSSPSIYKKLTGLSFFITYEEIIELAAHVKAKDAHQIELAEYCMGYFVEEENQGMGVLTSILNIKKCIIIHINLDELSFFEYDPKLNFKNMRHLSECLIIKNDDNNIDSIVSKISSSKVNRFIILNCESIRDSLISSFTESFNCLSNSNSRTLCITRKRENKHTIVERALKVVLFDNLRTYVTIKERFD